MPGLLDFLNSPATIMGLSVLNQNDRPAAGLLQGMGINSRLATQAQARKNAKTRNEMNKLAIINAQMQQEDREKMQKLIGTPPSPYAPDLFPGETASTLSGQNTAGLQSGGAGILGGQVPLDQNTMLQLAALSPNPANSFATLLNATNPKATSTSEAERLIATLPPKDQPAARAARLRKLTEITSASNGSEFERLIQGLSEGEKNDLRKDRADSLAGRMTDRSRDVSDRGRTNIKLRERGLSLSAGRLEHTISQDAFKNANTLRDDLDSRAKPLREQDRLLDQLELSLEGDINALDNKAVTNLLSRALNTNVRAQAELDSFKNFGDLAERLSGAVSNFFTGVRTQSQLDQVKQYVSALRNNIIAPGISELERTYAGAAIRHDLNPDDVVMKGGKSRAQEIQNEIDQIDRELLGK